MIFAEAHDLRDVIGREAWEADPPFRRLHFEQGLELEHAARAVANDVGPDRGGDRIRANRDRGRVSRNENPHAAASSISRRALASSSLAKTRSPIIAEGPLAQRPRQ
jgi:hypothetical protein